MSKMFGTNPKGATKKAGKKAEKKNSGNAENSLAPETEPAVTSSTTSEPEPAASAKAPTATTRSMKQMELKLVRSTAPRKSQRLVIYNIEGRSGSVQFLSTLFGGDQKSQGNPPESLTLSGEFAEPKPPKAKETPEERKARLAALPKPTLEEKVRKAEERAQKLREKLAKAGAAQNAGTTQATPEGQTQPGA